MGIATDNLVALKPGESARLAGYEWRLEGITDVQGPNYAARRATVTVTRDGAVVTVLTPERRTFQVDRQTTTEAAIHTNLMRDLYAVLGEERDGAGVLRLHHNPFAPWLWFGSIIMALGAGLSLSDLRMRVAAPAPKGATAPA
jgi:cytochrome c-type biogenesis protein CcmF